MIATELCDTLRIEQQQLEELCGRGLPFHHDGESRIFEPNAVRRWLIEEGIATVAIVQTAAEVAKYFDVNRSTPAKWFSSGCPGSPGAYDLVAISQWRSAQRKPPAESPLDDEEQLRFDMMLLEMQREEEREERAKRRQAKRIRENSKRPQTPGEKRKETLNHLEGVATCSNFSEHSRRSNSSRGGI
jgi:hypothetical protein